MHRPLKVSASILIQVPIDRRTHTLDNLRWILRNVQLSNTQRTELYHAIGVERRYQIKKKL
jgi:hypothetical protein